jgi:hypothetical protein
MVKLDEDMAKAMKKMERGNRINVLPPGIDCGVCGAPSCLGVSRGHCARRKGQIALRISSRK